MFASLERKGGEDFKKRKRNDQVEGTKENERGGLSGLIFFSFIIQSSSHLEELKILNEDSEGFSIVYRILQF